MDTPPPNCRLWALFPPLAGALAASALLAAGCGEADTDQVRALALLASETDVRFCESATDSFIEDFYEDGLSDCVQTARENAQLAARPHIRVNGITANGDTATADIAIRESTVRLSYVKQDGKWKLDRWRAAAVDPTQDGRPSITRGLSVPATVRAYYTAIGSENGAALCGLLSKNEARRLLRDSSEDQPRLACVQALNDFDWAAAKKKAGNARILGSVTAGNGARVRVSNGTRLSLARTRNGRWVIDGLASR